MASRIRTIAAALATAINAWPSLPAGMTASRQRSIRYDANSLGAGKIVVICPEVEDNSERGEVAETAKFGIVMIARCTSDAVAQSDAYEDAIESLYDYLRTQTSLKNIALTGNLAAHRRTVNLVTTCDADMLDEAEIFVAVIEATYGVSVGNRS